MAKYVPPSKRAGYVPSAPPPDSIRSATPSARGGRGANGHGVSHSNLRLEQHFTHVPESTFTFFSYLPRAVDPYKRPAHDPTRTPYNTPLPPSPPPPPPRHPHDDLVSFIRVFPDAHPAWSTHRELWVHTSADKFLADYAREKLNFGRPIPLFNTRRERQISSFIFGGYWLIDELLEVQPQSDELKRMLMFKDEQRGYRGGRTAGAWRQALQETWVRLKLSPAPPRGSHYDSLRAIMDVQGGIDGEVEAYMLRIGGLREQLGILEDSSEEREKSCEQAGLKRHSHGAKNDK